MVSILIIELYQSRSHILITDFLTTCLMVSQATVFKLHLTPVCDSTGTKDADYYLEVRESNGLMHKPTRYEASTTFHFQPWKTLNFQCYNGALWVF